MYKKTDYILRLFGKLGNCFVSLFSFFLHYKKTATTRIFILVSQPLIFFQRKTFIENLS